MSTLGKRLTALEEIAERMRLQPIRELAAERGLDPARLNDLYEECRHRTERLRSQGLTEGQILALTAQRLGCTVEELQTRVDALRVRFGLN
jgi:hypothetical protein